MDPCSARARSNLNSFLTSVSRIARVFFGPGQNFTKSKQVGGSLVNTRRLFRTGFVVVALTTIVAAGTTPATADGVYTPWSSMLPGWTDQFVPSSDNDCAAGRPNCLDASLKELSRILS